ncbi:MAG TPA: glycosyltransferase family 2 protein [Verrucomicrobiae bacterium]|nr:glycosyltransferase family 2 protein [Verrucomicrobiae bacterium]
MPDPEMPIFVSIGIIAWNEEEAIAPMLESLFRQTFFAELARRRGRCEIICLANGCTDKTCEVAGKIFSDQTKSHPHADLFSGRVVELKQRGKINAWNAFVHSVSSKSAGFLFLMDADIVIHNRETLWNMLFTLLFNREANIAVDRPCKDIEFKPRNTWREKISLAASRLTRSSAAQLCAQLYCIRAEIARNIYLPKDLAACDDGFIKSLVCTDFLAHPVWPMRILPARNASHTFEAYTSLKTIFKNQKRQAIGQTIVHILVDNYLRKLSPIERSKLAETLRKKEIEDPNWLKRLVSTHIGGTRFFWQLYPGLLGHRFRRLSQLSFLDRIICLPAAIAGFLVSLCSCFAASRFLKSGCVEYWPRAKRNGLRRFDSGERRLARLTPLKAHQD